MNVGSIMKNLTTDEGVKVWGNFVNPPSKAHPGGVDVLLILVRDNPNVYLPPALHWLGSEYKFESDGNGVDGSWARYVRELAQEK